MNATDPDDSEPKGRDYNASQEELQAIDAATEAIDRGEIATDTEVEAAFAKFRRRQ